MNKQTTGKIKARLQKTNTSLKNNITKRATDRGGGGREVGEAARQERGDREREKLERERERLYIEREREIVHLKYKCLQKSETYFWCLCVKRHQNRHIYDTSAKFKVFQNTKESFKLSYIQVKNENNSSPTFTHVCCTKWMVICLWSAERD